MSRILKFWIVLAVAALAIATNDPNERLMAQLVKEYKVNTKKHLELSGYGSSCRPDNIAVRKEWGNLSRRSRLEYIHAVKCLHRLPSQIDPELAPGARSRYDDFLAAHMRLAPKIHGTGLFLPWHRHFMHLYETALRDECGYSGYHPYWDWSKYVHRPHGANPLYDGSATSMSGNGWYIPGRNGTLQPLPIQVPNPPAIYCPPGTGGGHIERGPFVDWKANLGPAIIMNVRNGLPVPPNPRPDGLGYNPRRIIRDFNNTLLESNTYQVVTNMLTTMPSIHQFHPYFYRGPHRTAHLFISGYDNDFYTSPLDPLFYFHHAQVDRIWAIWQALDFPAREYALDGTLTMENTPPSRNVTLNDIMSFEFDDPIRVGERMSPTKNGLCYMYD
ncbi:hypothetical protein E4U42_002217 [Claviceps africana]|uniref:Tyrosinase copper-binding domain-containing protein n=1 Tax=Claviceps africana TaxID=83212 RepID=A0A8K0J8J2_9HYPO|nr:hypothetical protein E4U42_002217 [Claviceps africana]